MSVAVEFNNGPGTQQLSPREASRPAPMTVNRIAMNFPTERDSPSKISPIVRQSTLTGSHEESQGDINAASRNDQSHYQVPNLSSMLYEFTNQERDRV